MTAFWQQGPLINIQSMAELVLQELQRDFSQPQRLLLCDHVRPHQMPLLIHIACIINVNSFNTAAWDHKLCHSIDDGAPICPVRLQIVASNSTASFQTQTLLFPDLACAHPACTHFRLVSSPTPWLLCNDITPTLQETTDPVHAPATRSMPAHPQPSNQPPPSPPAPPMLQQPPSQQQLQAIPSQLSSSFFWPQHQAHPRHPQSTPAEPLTQAEPHMQPEQGPSAASASSGWPGRPAFPAGSWPMAAAQHHAQQQHDVKPQRTAPSAAASPQVPQPLPMPHRLDHMFKPAGAAVGTQTTAASGLVSVPPPRPQPQLDQGHQELPAASAMSDSRPQPGQRQQEPSSSSPRSGSQPLQGAPQPERSQTLREALADWVAEALGLRAVAEAARECTQFPTGSLQGSPQGSADSPSSPTSSCTSGPPAASSAQGSASSAEAGRMTSSGPRSSTAAGTSLEQLAQGPEAEITSASFSTSTQPLGHGNGRLEALIDAVVEQQLRRILSAALGSRASSRTGSMSGPISESRQQSGMSPSHASTPTSGSYAGTPNFRVDQVQHAVVLLRQSVMCVLACSPVLYQCQTVSSLSLPETHDSHIQ